MARALLITNPAAARTEPGAIRAVCAVLRKRGLDVDVAGTTSHGDAAGLARQGADDGVDLVVVYGGDGTAMQVVRGIVGRDIPIGLIPGGTGNILAGNLRIPMSPRRAAEVVARGAPRRIDLGRVDRADGPHYFAVNCGAGFDADLMHATSAAAKRRWGFAAYVTEALRGLGDITSVPHRITVDDQVLEANAATVMIANCAELIPPYVRLKRDIAFDDGQLDVIILEASGVVSSVAVFARLVLGVEGGETIRYARGRRITVDAAVPRAVQLDGEPTGTTPFTAEVLPGAMRVVAPAD
ncbi:MAG: diacylglycerol kinase family lipid kinase [Gemmatimonadetes bacterium]|nr:diacylglycerol kinase family lipid kinase [Gemmatimonadota bacterium]